MSEREPLVAASLGRRISKAQTTIRAAVDARSPLRSSAAWAALRLGLGTAGLLASFVLITGLGTDIHDLAWFVYYGWSPAEIPQTATDAPAWLGWVLVAMLALRWCRIAAAAAWLAFAGMLAELVTGMMLPTPQTGEWLLLAAMAASGLSLAPRWFRATVEVGWRRVLTVAAAVVFVLFARLLGHHFTTIYTAAWMALTVAVAYAAHPRTVAGSWALVVLSFPALSAIITMIATDMFAFDIYRPSLPWTVVVIAFYGPPALAVTMLAVALHFRRLHHFRSERR